MNKELVLWLNKCNSLYWLTGPGIIQFIILAQKFGYLYPVTPRVGLNSNFDVDIYL